MVVTHHQCFRGPRANIPVAGIRGGCSPKLVPFAFGFEGRKHSVMEEKAAAASNTCAGGDFSEDM